MAKRERTYYCRRHVCTSCGRYRRFSPLSDLCGLCGGTMKAGIMEGTEYRISRLWGLSHRWQRRTETEVFHRWEEDKEAVAS